MQKVVLREYWPENKSGEMETLERISEAFRIIGLEAVKVPVGAGEDQAIQRLNPLFALDIHYEAPRLAGVFSVGALWNPADYYTFWGGADTIARQAQHDYFVAANPRVASDWLNVLAPDYKHGVLPFNHTVPSSAIRPPNSSARNQVFYAGIGWDRNASGLQRHEEVFRTLEKKNVLEIYGPKKIANGISPWDDFSSYKGELPFDGEALVGKINEVKFALALSSLSHLRSQIASNRIFESIAGGAIPIVDKNIDFPFDISEAIQFDNELPVDEAANQVFAAMQEIAADAELRFEKIQRLQANLRNGFTLDEQLRDIVARVQDLKAIQLTSNNPTNFSVRDVFEMASSVDPAQSQIDHKINSNHLSLLLHRFFSENPEIPDWVVFNASLVKSLGGKILDDFAHDQVDVLHLAGSWRNGESTVYIGGDALAPEKRIVDSFVVRGSIVRDWFLHSQGLASLGSMLQALVLDNGNDNGALNHRVVRGNNFRIEASENPINTEALCSNLDLAVLATMAKLSDTKIASLAGQANLHGLLLASVSRPTQSVLGPLVRELNALGLKLVIRLGFQYVWSRFRK